MDLLAGEERSPSEESVPSEDSVPGDRPAGA
jgi:hypothetical protein